MNKHWLTMIGLASCWGSLAFAQQNPKAKSNLPQNSALSTESKPKELNAAGLTIPAAKIHRSHKDVYSSSAGPQLLLILHVPKEAGSVYIELHNRTAEEISFFGFTLSALGHEGELEFDDLPAGWSSMKEVKVSSLRELAIRNARAFNQNADEITPRLVIHQVEWLGTPPKTGRHKI